MKKKPTPEEQIKAFWDTFNFYCTYKSRKAAYKQAVIDHGFHPPVSKQWINKQMNECENNWVKK